MTTEQKAKAYDEVVNKLRRFMEQGVNPLITRADVQDFFPELKESEGEKIRKDLITFLDDVWHLGKNANFDKWGKADCSDWIAWLEKQSNDSYLQEKINAFTSAHKGEDPEEIIAACRSYEKQGEQKPSTEGTFVNVDEVREDFMREVYRVLDADPTNDRANQIIDAFDNLPTVAIQPTEWSEEDSYMLGQAIKCVNNSGRLDVSTEEIEDWLKSLRPNYWKPSEDQMTALAEALSLAKNCGEDWSFDLRTLHEQLKKL